MQATPAPVMVYGTVDLPLTRYRAYATAAREADGFRDGCGSDDHTMMCYRVTRSVMSRQEGMWEMRISDVASSVCQCRRVCASCGSVTTLSVMA